MWLPCGSHITGGDGARLRGGDPRAVRASDGGDDKLRRDAKGGKIRGEFGRLGAAEVLEEGKRSVDRQRRRFAAAATLVAWMRRHNGAAAAMASATNGGGGFAGKKGKCEGNFSPGDPVPLFMGQSDMRKAGSSVPTSQT